MSLPLYVAETRYYRRVLGISWEFGSRLRKAGVLVPDAMLDNDKFLYRLSPETLAQNQALVTRYRDRSGVPQTNVEPIYVY